MMVPVKCEQHLALEGHEGYVFWSSTQHILVRSADGGRRDATEARKVAYPEVFHVFGSSCLPKHGQQWIEQKIKQVNLIYQPGWLMAWPKHACVYK